METHLRRYLHSLWDTELGLDEVYALIPRLTRKIGIFDVWFTRLPLPSTSITDEFMMPACRVLVAGLKQITAQIFYSERAFRVHQLSSASL